jgi:hypothetical protein
MDCHRNKELHCTLRQRSREAKETATIWDKHRKA